MKITLTDVKSGYNLSPLNANFQALQKELHDKVLYRDNPTGEPNQMEGPLDMNNNNIQNVNELDVVTFKIQGEDATQFLNESVQQAETFANAAESSATDAQTAEDGADLALYNFEGTWYGSLASEPTLDPNGEAITDGDLYSNSTDGILYFYQGGTWNPLGGGNVTSVFGRTGAVTALAGDYTAAEVDYDNTTSGLTATDTQAAIDELGAEKADSADLGTASTKDFGTSTGNLPEYQEEIVELGGQFNVGESVKCSRIGNQVTISSTTGTLGHVSSSSALSDDGILPTWARPNTGGMQNTYINPIGSTVEYASVNITASGRLATQYNDTSGTFVNRTDTRIGFSITYNV